MFKKKNGGNRQKDMMKGHFYTFSFTHRILGFIVIPIIIIFGKFMHWYNMPWVLEHRLPYQTFFVSVFLLFAGFIVMSRGRKEDDFSRYIRNMTNWFILRLTLVFSIVCYADERMNKIVVSHDAFIVTILLAYLFYYYGFYFYLKGSNEKLDKTREGED